MATCDTKKAALRIIRYFFHEYDRRPAAQAKIKNHVNKCSRCFSRYQALQAAFGRSNAN